MGWLAPPEFLVALVMTLGWVVGAGSLWARIVRRHRRDFRENRAGARWRKRDLLKLVLLAFAWLAGCVALYVVVMLSPPWAQVAAFFRGGGAR